MNTFGGSIMAEFRQIYTRIWKDEWFSNLEPESKLFFIYLFSNEMAEVGGIYELPLKYMPFETGIKKDKILSYLEQFEKDQKVFYRDGWIWVVHLRKYNETDSSKIIKRIQKILDNVPGGELKYNYCKYYDIPYEYPIDTLSTPLEYPIDTCKNFCSDRDRDRDRDKDSDTPISEKPEITSPKKSYGEFENVTFTDQEYQKLQTKFPTCFGDWIEKLSVWKESKGKKTKSDYATILNWARMDKEKNPEVKKEDTGWKRAN